MENSSDEDLNSDNEFIDLKPLWRDSPFLSDSTSDTNEEEEVRIPEIEDSSSDKADFSTRSISYTPPLVTAPSTDVHRNLDTFMAEMNARRARRRLVGQFVPNQMQSNRPWTSGSSQNRNISLRYAADQNNTIENESIPEHPSSEPFPHLLPERPPRRLRGLWSSNSFRRPILGRNFASLSVPTLNNQSLTSMEPNFSDLPKLSLVENDNNEKTLIEENDTKFVLPAALKEKEKENEKGRVESNEVFLAERAEFVAQLLMSICKLTSDQQKSIAVFGSKNRKQEK